jgi:hypothetical protein
MANEIRVMTRLQFLTDGTITRSVPQSEANIATTSNVISDATQLVGTTHEQIAAADVTDDAFAMIENLSATAEVQVGGDASSVFVPWFTIPPGGSPAILPLVAALADTYLISDEAATPVRVTLIKVVAPA